ncbi:MAG: hypothetical protein H6732_10330 [Alphaproteobacteria bacterium]|nr:hypothetical protein [Alphaproteobacteria bacterium]
MRGPVQHLASALLVALAACNQGGGGAPIKPGGDTDGPADSGTDSADTARDDTGRDDTGPTSAGVLQVGPARLVFDPIPPGCTSPARTVLVENTGDQAVQLVVDAVEGASAAAFTVEPPANARLGPGATVELLVRFSPTAVTSYVDASFTLGVQGQDARARVALEGEGQAAAMVTERFTQRAADDVDVLWVIDNSASMQAYQGDLGAAFPGFTAALDALGVTWRMGATTSDMSPEGAQGALLGPVLRSTDADPTSAFQDLLELEEVREPCAGADTGMACGADTEMPFDAAHAALTTLAFTAPNSDLRRPGARLAVLLLSNEDDASAGTFATPTGAARGTAFATMLQGLVSAPDRATFSAISGPDGKPNPLGNACPGGIFAQRTAYNAAALHAAIRATGGAWKTICTAPTAAQLGRMARVAAGQQVGLVLDPAPPATGPTDLQVTVAGTAVPADTLDGWSWDAASTTLVLHGDAIPDPGEELVVTYTLDAGACATP